MPAYRVYCIDGAGMVWTAQWIEADDDPSALSAAQDFDNCVRCEVWQADRFVGRVDTNSGAREI